MNNYILSNSLQRAVNIALHLNKPLLLCGEPGTGKTTLAKHLAERFNLHNPGNYAKFYEKPLMFDTKTTSVATDLFYHYDALGRLRDAYSQEETNPGDYIELRALGKAIVFKHGSKSAKLDGIRSIIDFTGGKKKEKERAVKSRLGFTSRQSTDLHPATEPEHGMPANTEKKSSLPEEPTSSIVLIDEIDKAPRDFPNDILNEIEEQVFTIKELGERVPPADTNAKILVIMTSNNEKNLPDAFLRRCIYHYIEFPDTRQLEEIVNAHFPHLAKKVEDHKGSGKEEPLPEKQVMGIINTFNELRSLPLLKKPATAEFIDWLHILEQENLLDEAQQPYPSLPENIKKQLEHSMGLLFKNNNDITQVREAMKKM